ncbi:hypothetical protein P153DRAFT_153767 [Dothidotthia symphoricarpi CBS 119687]|uniref:Uncharacterized protein n=1 Tax=Dothidotthia symphoricarpi CBS 119687 TaxID=1392245 RepID=A0A6A6AQ05_9PLEO|nr:uncharacterized protein P153DRAFT_153767 [Dothidotthia symphoricarpi CBS 119687]KAF2133283.1 hypothetical protein P153DRAFT_153767 [Dothidotthia symphoricarpi CBS 119687]
MYDYYLISCFRKSIVGVRRFHLSCLMRYQGLILFCGPTWSSPNSSRRTHTSAKFNENFQKILFLSNTSSNLLSIKLPKSYIYTLACKIVHQSNNRPAGPMARRLTTICSKSRDCRFDPCVGHLFASLPFTPSFFRDWILWAGKLVFTFCATDSNDSNVQEVIWTRQRQVTAFRHFVLGSNKWIKRKQWEQFQQLPFKRRLPDKVSCRLCGSAAKPYLSIYKSVY